MLKITQPKKPSNLIAGQEYFILNNYCLLKARLEGILEKTGTDTDRRTVLTDSYDGQLWKRRTVMEKTDCYGKDGLLWKRRTVMEKTDSYGKDGQLWKRRTVMEKTGSYGKDGQLWKRRAVMEKTDSYGKDGHKAFTYKKPRILIRLA